MGPIKEKERNGTNKEKERNGVRVHQGGKIVVGILQKAERIPGLGRELSVETGYWIIIGKGMMNSGDKMMIVLWWLRKGKDYDNNNNSNNNYLRVLRICFWLLVEWYHSISNGF